MTRSKDIKKTKRVMRIRCGEFLLNVSPNGFQTTHHIRSAIDIDGLDMQTLLNIANQLKKMELNMEIVEYTYK